MTDPGERQLTNLKTRYRLLEAAGRVFAEKGPRAATGRDICDRAGANPAAISYHFGGKDELYVETLREAHRRLFSREQLEELVDTDLEDPAKLSRFVHVVVHGLLDPGEDRWHGRLITRELMDPSTKMDVIVQEEIRPKAELLSGVIARVAGVSPDHPAVWKSLVSIVGQCLFLYLGRSILQRVFDHATFSPEEIDEVAEHIVRFSIGGLGRVREEIDG